MKRRLSLAQQLFILQLAVIVLLVSAGAGLALLDARSNRESEARERVIAIASSLAQLPEVRAAVTQPDPSATLQPIAESVRGATRVDFVVFMATDRTRYSHPNPERIGESFIGTIEPALADEIHTEKYAGTLGPSMRTVVPIHADDGEVAALVSVGILQHEIGRQLRERIPTLVAVSLLALAVAAAGSYAISRRLRRQTLGLGPIEITRMFQHHDAVLHSVREGLLVVDPDGALVLANDEAVRLLGLSDGFEGRPVDELSLPEPLTELISSGLAREDELHVVGDRILVANQQPAYRDGRLLGVVTTLRDHTELEELSGELDSVRGFAEALRAQAHESANRLHTIVTMIELGQSERALEFATSELATAQQLADQLMSSVSEPALAALLLGKAAQAAEKGIEFAVTDDTSVGADTLIEPRDLVTVLGNLIDNAIDAALAAPAPRWVRVTALAEPGALVLRVADSGGGLDPAAVDVAFNRGWTTKTDGGGLGLALVRQVIDRHGGTVDVTGDGGAVFTVRLPYREGAS
jgi:two-component system, CitB family, sensor kinase